MSFVIAFLTFILFLVCILLCLLILVQLPKKEAGMGTAFGGDAAVAMFGAGSGTALTRMTKYTAGTFLVLCVLLTTLNAHVNHSRSSSIERELSKPQANTQTGAAQPFSSLMAPAATNVPVATPSAKADSNTIRKAVSALTNAVNAVAQPTNGAVPQK